jgi:colanic acid/amylovoran biosynthesis protein
MGKIKEIKKFIDISGFNINQPNRGNAALSYGALGFLIEKGLINEGDELIYFHAYNNFLKRKNTCVQYESYVINGREWKRTIVPVHKLEMKLITKFGIILPFTYFGRYVKKVRYEAADYGGDGFSDIYGDSGFLNRMNQTWMLWRANVPLIMLPQTIGPFAKKSNYDIAVKIMRYAKDIYVRDGKFIPEFEKLGLKYTQTKDISSFMQPEPWEIDIKPKPLGLNVSGLAYCNTYHGLEGQFDAYPELIDKLIKHYRDKGFTVYLVPHSYTYNKPDNNDDMIACRQAYARLTDKSNVVLIDKDMTAPQVKYVISKMKYFIGARMHANFAAIYTGVPVFGTAYSYKFQGAFDANGLDGEKQTAMLNNLKESEIDGYIEKIDKAFGL